MKKILQIIAAYWGAKKLNKFGCVGFVVIFIILYLILGKVL
ncbi:hypothetical protein SAMN04487990_11836 [Bizionia paragorgiae]|uniref:Uncharacterized protein n=1 Tax=Bizionia paragorgiae TaxID=283786 RepID=A0A1H4C6U2_BIZPA|nr:hypothetical protein SAMN04487990_11836 [Bizionia paragorgiae]